MEGVSHWGGSTIREHLVKVCGKQQVVVYQVTCSELFNYEHTPRDLALSFAHRACKDDKASDTDWGLL